MQPVADILQICSKSKKSIIVCTSRVQLTLIGFNELVVLLGVA
jgi:hypothetical protein